ncbi:hypothetical protein RSAG8_13660, partial [Rhizoctonia solani AG-8 WAC10335]
MMVAVWEDLDHMISRAVNVTCTVLLAGLSRVFNGSDIKLLDDSKYCLADSMSRVRG